VNTELHWDSIPPGFVQKLEDGRLLQQYFHDFFNFAGLNRSVWLHATSLTHVGDVTVTTSKSWIITAGSKPRPWTAKSRTTTWTE
jgi:beta-glucuronidase